MKYKKPFLVIMTILILLQIGAIVFIGWWINTMLHIPIDMINEGKIAEGMAMQKNQMFTIACVSIMVMIFTTIELIAGVLKDIRK